MTFRNRVAWLAFGITLLWVAWLSLKHVESGELFLFQLPFDPMKPFDGRGTERADRHEERAVSLVKPTRRLDLRHFLARRR